MLLRDNFSFRLWVLELPICTSHARVGFSPDQSTDFCFKAKCGFLKFCLEFTQVSTIRNCVLLILETAVRANLDKFKSHYCQMWLELVCSTKCCVISFPGKKATSGVSKFLLILSCPVLRLCFFVSYWFLTVMACVRGYSGHCLALSLLSVPSGSISNLLQVLLGLPPRRAIVSCQYCLLLTWYVS